MKLFGQGAILLGLVLLIFGIYLFITGAGMASLVVVGLGLLLAAIGGGAWMYNPGAPQRARTPAIDRSRSVWR